jgi:hypothetical protein
VEDAVSLKEQYNFPNGLGWGLGEVGSGSTSADLAWDPTQPRVGGGSGTSDSGGGGGVRKIGLSEGTGMESKSIGTHDQGPPRARLWRNRFVRTETPTH